MGKTVPSYRVALEHEKQRWNNFTKALRPDEKEVFEQLMNICKNHASAASNATRPVLFEAMAMTILLDQQKTINQLKNNYKKSQTNSTPPKKQFIYVKSKFLYELMFCLVKVS